jgi:hypothetical protein
MNKLALTLGILALTGLPAWSTTPQTPAESWSDTLDATTVTISVLARDAGGRPVGDLDPNELLLTEDGIQRPIVSVVRWLEPSSSAPSTAVTPAGAAGATPETVPSIPAAPTTVARSNGQVLVYVDAVLSSGRGIDRTLTHLAGQAPRLVELGTVDVVVADPAARQQLSTRDPEVLRTTLERLARETSGSGTHARIRSEYLRAVEQDGITDLLGVLARPQGGGSGGGRPQQPTQPGSPGTPGGGAQRPQSARESTQLADSHTRSSRQRQLALAAAKQEAAVLARQRGQLTDWVAATDRGVPGALFLVSDGFDTDPRDFYLATYQDGSITAELASDLRPLDAGPDLERLATLLAGAGWVVYPIALGDLESQQTNDASTSGRARARSFGRDRRVFGELTTFTFQHPMEPLTLLADTSGGELVVSAEAIAASVATVGERLLVTYQVDRAPDGRIRDLALTTSRPGVTLTTPRVAAAAAPDALVANRVRRAVAGQVETGELPVTLDLDVDGREGSTITGTVAVAVDLQALASWPEALVAAATLRVTLGVLLPDGKIFVSQQMPPRRDLRSLPSWLHRIPLKLPAGTTTVAIVVDDLGSGAWGSARVQPIP